MSHPRLRNYRYQPTAPAQLQISTNRPCSTTDINQPPLLNYRYQPTAPSAYLLYNLTTVNLVISVWRELDALATDGNIFGSSGNEMDR
ncbi:hypothetical protein AVEN_272512-1 [Araneus ventricosus]|uniref:Uncharacterized protein n=1 Tax=Araneus ventricosus TaxID=182803 RepID=A0A4Y2SI20_ARAVE|nr:hypothetical protein AVEN_272512-1 [Araneus ventricosus]